jgi:hypothetical protein
MVILDIEEGKCTQAHKLRIFDDQERVMVRALHE